MPQALEAANQGWNDFQSSQPSWAWKFRVLKAEVLVWQGKAKDAFAETIDNLPADLNNPELQVRIKIVQGLACSYLRKFDDAKNYLSSAEQLSQSQGAELQAYVQVAWGVLAINKESYPEALQHQTAALRLARLSHNQFLEASALGNLGAIALRRQHYSESVDWSQETLAIARKLNNKTMESKLFGNLGWCLYSMGDYDRALENYTEAEKLSASLGLLSDQLKWINNIGLIAYARRDYANANANYARALEIARKLEDTSAAVIALNNLAATAIDSGQFDKAEEFNREAADLESKGGNRLSKLYTLLNGGRIAAGRAAYSEAEALYKRVILGSGEEISLRWEAETNLAGLYALEGKAALAESQYRRALATIDTARAALSREEHRLSFLTTATRFYNAYIDFLVSHGRAREALAVAEHSRARTLAEGLKLPVGELKAAAFQPEQNARKLKSVILSYWLKPEQSYLWVVTPSKVSVFQLPGEDQINGTVQEYRKALLGPRQEVADAPGQKLYEMLVAPAQKLLPKAEQNGSRDGHSSSDAAPRIVVISDGSLLSLNFETLLVPTPKPHYWIEDATVSNASSIALLAASANGRSDAGTQNEKVLLIGDPNYSGTEFPQLTQAKTEVQRIEKYFPPAGRVVIEGTNAVPAAYTASRPGEFGYIHFVAHGTASRISPLDSSIVLSKEGDSYKLYARDIMRQPLHADLVTISACYGAGNRAYSGEGLVGLSWAFLRAGAHNVIAALWEVNDASTPQLMDKLYLNVKKGEDPATALRSAKLAMLHSETVYRRPFYWGAFQLYVGS